MAGLGRMRQAREDATNRGLHYRDNFMGMSAHDRHQMLISDYLQFYGGAEKVAEAGGLEAVAAQHQASQVQSTDVSALKAGHRFIRSAADDADTSLAARLAKKYYDRLFKEYCIVDLSRYKESKLGLRWRTQKEVVVGKGQFSCGAKGCDVKDGLVSYEVNFAYEEAGARKQALVKLRVCPECAIKLNWKREKEFRKAQAKVLSKATDRAQEHSASGSKRGRPGAADFFEGEAGAGGSKVPRVGFDKPEDKDWVAPPPGAVQQQSAAAAQGDAVAYGSDVVQPSVLPADNSIWEQKAPQQEATAEEDFDSYLENMFL